MKFKNYSLLVSVLFLLFSNFTHAQVHLNIGQQVEYIGDQVKVFVTVDGFEDMIGMQFSMHYNPEVLEFESLGDFNLPNLSSGVFGVPNGTSIDPGDITSSWIDDDLSGETLTDGDHLFSITFNILLDVESFLYIDGTPTPIEFFNIAQEIQTVTTQGGFINGATVSGRLFIDANGNCVLDDGEESPGEWLLELEGDEPYYVYSREDGSFAFNAPIGIQSLKAYPPNDYWGTCEESIEFEVVSVDDEITINYGVTIETACPAMYVDLSTNFLRRCFSSYYTVSYCNYGTIDATDAQVEVDFDPYLNVITSTIPWSAVNGNTYTFDLGDVPYGDCGSFQVEVLVDCENTTLGQTHCSEAYIYPDTICTPTDPLWSGASLQISGDCEGDLVNFLIENVGDQGMDEAIQYIVIEDAVMMYGEEAVQLAAGEDHEFSLPANGSTYRVEVPQVAGHPGFSMPSLSIEGCGTDNDGEFTTGFISQFPQNENDGFISIDCRENIGAFDPNDKQAFPRGFGENYYIEANQDLEYLIRFQNTGTDTAFNVVVVDTLSESLDLTSIRPGASSHPYNLEIEGGKYLHFYFENIMLPDSNINEPASHGFVQFKIAQRADLPLETVIENSAAIYFDFNEPVITNTVFHTIGEDFLEIINAYPTVAFPNAEVVVYPNPFSERAEIRLEGVELDKATFQLYHSSGQLLKTAPFTQNKIHLDGSDLSSGCYFFTIRSHAHLVATGKLIVR